MRWCIPFLLAIALPAPASEEAAGELRDARQRAGIELEARVRDLERMLETIERLSSEQNEYIEMLQRRIEALLREEGDS